MSGISMLVDAVNGAAPMDVVASRQTGAVMQERWSPTSAMQRIRVLRLIARLNIGGPARHVDVLCADLDPARFETWLVTGVPDPHEGEQPPQPAAHVHWIRLPRLRRALHPVNDLVVLWQLWRLCHRIRPHVVHTHTAKAGALGRLAAWLYNTLGARRDRASRCVVVHTFHGHVLEGYFSRPLSRFFTWVEQWLARRTDCVITVGPLVREELLARRISRPQQITVVPLGLHLEALLALAPPTPKDDVVIGIVGRLVPIKRHELFLQAVALAVRRQPAASWRARIIGDGPQREIVQRWIRDLGLTQRAEWIGWEEDLPRLYGALDVVCLTSRQEGTPVSLIEAMAAARPVISTDVGSVRDLLGRPTDDEAGGRPRGRAHGWVQYEHGLLVTEDEPATFANALEYLRAHPEERLSMGSRGRCHVRGRFAAARLVQDIEALYRQLLTPGRRSG